MGKLMLNEEVRASIEESVLCWLATVDSQGFPNVSPKEIFLAHGPRELIIADIASPTSVKNIKSNPRVCVSFVHVFKQKGYKLKGSATYLTIGDDGFEPRSKKLSDMAGGSFDVRGVICVHITSVQSILAPSYLFMKDVSEADQVRNALDTYGVQKAN